MRTRSGSGWPSEEAERERREEERRQRRAALLKYVVLPAAVILLVAGAAAVFWPDDGGSGGSTGDGGTTEQGDVPAPFESADLWSMAEPYFEPGRVSACRSRARRRPWRGTCRGPSCSSAGARTRRTPAPSCAPRTETDFDAVRAAFLGEAVGDTEPVDRAARRAGRAVPLPGGLPPRPASAPVGSSGTTTAGALLRRAADRGDRPRASWSTTGPAAEPGEDGGRTGASIG